MNKNIYLTIGLILPLMINAAGQVKEHQISRPDINDAIDRIIIAHSANLDSLICPSRIWITDEVPTQYDPVFGVIINKNKIINLAINNKYNDYDNLLRMFIAHEKMHALQDNILRSLNLDITKLDNEDRQRLECQADMGAGYTLLFPYIKEYSAAITKAIIYDIDRMRREAGLSGVTTVNFADGDSVMATNMLAHFKEGIKLFFELGETDGLFGTHPIPQYRKQAFELGVDAFSVSAMMFPLSKDISNNIDPAAWKMLQERFGMVKWTLGIFPQDFDRNGSFFVQWSDRTVRKIMHIMNKAINNVVFKMLDTRWDPSADNSFYYFNFEIVNNNTDSVMVDFDIPIFHVNRTVPGDILEQRISSSYHRIVLLAPRTSVTISDSTVWIPAIATNMPSVKLPGVEGSLYYIAPKSPKDYRIYMPSSPVSGVNPLANDRKPPVSFPIMVQQLQQDFRFSSPDKFKDGAGILFEYSDYTEYNYYNYDRHFTLHVPLDVQGNMFLRHRIGDYASINEANKAVNDHASQLLQLSDDYKAIYKNGANGTVSAIVKDGIGKTQFSLQALKDRYGFYTVIEIYK